MSRNSVQTWTRLLEAGVVQGDPPPTGVPESPWFVKVLLAFCGWLAAIFLLGFLGLRLDFIFDSISVAFFLGWMMIGAAFFVLRANKNEFVEHMALALSMAGQAVLVFVIIDVADPSDSLAWLLVGLMQITLSLFMPNFVHRVFSSFIGVFALAMTLTSLGWAFLVSGIFLFVAAFCMLNEFRFPEHMKKMRAIGYGVLLAMICLKANAIFGHAYLADLFDLDQAELWLKPWVGEVLTGAATLYVVWHILQGYSQSVSSRVSIAVLAGTLIYCCLSFKVQGITLGLVIMLLGFNGANHVLTGMGIASLLFYISTYYYLMQTTLIEKSQTLFVVGLFLLAVRWLMGYVFPIQKEGIDA